MTHENTVITTLLQAAELNMFKDDYLVDVFRIWDCYTQDWIPDSPLLLRFETNDVLIREHDHGIITAKIGPVDVTAPPNIDDPRSQDACPCWLRVNRQL